MFSRRAFLKGGAVAMFGAGTVPAWLARAAEFGSGRKVLVAVFQRGAVDGLSAIVPYGDADYYKLRPTIAIPRAGILDLNGFFGLHPAMAPLKSFYDAGQLAIVDAAGSPHPTRSHFDAQDYMESGTPGVKSTRDGWLNRALPMRDNASPVRALAVSSTLPRALRGTNPAITVGRLEDFTVSDTRSAQALESAYVNSEGILAGAGRDTFQAVRLLQSVSARVTAAVDYPNGRFGLAMREIARVIKAGIGLEVAFADIGGWDTHVNQPNQLANLLREYSVALAAFHKDLGDRMQDVVVVTMSEFGRTARENGNQGTDHGHANYMMAFGGGIKGGQVLGRWPGLAPDQLHDGRDLALTTDFRDVLTDIVCAQLGTVNVDQLFPGYKAQKPSGIAA